MPRLDSVIRLLLAAALMALCGCSLIQRKPTADGGAAAGQTVPSSGDYRHALSTLKAGKDDDALKLFTAIAESHPDSAPAYINMGLIEIRKDSLPDAETALLHAAVLAPQQPEIYNALGIVYRRQGRFSDAEAAYLKALYLSPDYAKAHLNLGILYEIYLNRLGDALEHYQRYQAIAGNDNAMVKKWIIDVERRLAATKGAKK
jgi:Flp pilus assembly protein TadD